MARFRMIHTEFWSDPKMVEEMTPEDKYFFLYLLTNPNTTQVGIYQITKKQMAFDLGYTIEVANALLDRFINHHKLVMYIPETREIAIKNWGKYNLNKGGKPILDCVKSELRDVKAKELIQYVGERVEKEEIKRIYDSYHDTSTISGQKEEKEKEEQEEQYKQQQEQKEEAARKNEPHEKPPAVVVDYDFAEVVKSYELNFGLIPGGLAQILSDDFETYGKDLMLEAFKRAVLANRRTYAYVLGILKNWKNENIKTLSDLEAADLVYERKKGMQHSSSRAVKDEKVPDWLVQQQLEREGKVQVENSVSPEMEEQRRKLLESLGVSQTQEAGVING